MLSPEPPKEAIDKAQNFLLVGSDSRANIDPDDPNIGAFGSESEVGGQRSDTIMVLRIDPASERARRSCRSHATCGCRSRARGGKQRINTAFSRGPDVLVATLQQNFGIPIQHFVEVDFAGFKGLVDAVGGVPVYFENPARDKNTGLNIPVAGLREPQRRPSARLRALAALRVQGRQQMAHRRHGRPRPDQPPAGLHPALAEEGGREGHPQPDRAQPADRRRHQQRDGGQQPLGARSHPARKPLPLPRPVEDRHVHGAHHTHVDQRRFGAVAAGGSRAARARRLPRHARRRPATAPRPRRPCRRWSPRPCRSRCSTAPACAASPPRPSRRSPALSFKVTGKGDADSSQYERTIIRYTKGQEAAARTLASFLESGADLQPVDRGGSGRRPDHPRPRLHRACGRRL